MRTLRTLLVMALSAPPVLLVLSGCSFTAPGSIDSVGVPSFDAGDLPHADIIFCNVEADRGCASDEEIALGVDVANPYTDGFWTYKSTKYGLDHSPDALNACGNRPQKVVYKGVFPEGSPVCLNADSVLGPGKLYPTVRDACIAWVDSHGWLDPGFIPYNAQNIAWPSTGFWETPVRNACTPAGTLRWNFKDLRKDKGIAVTWRDAVNVQVTANSLRKTSVANGWLAGAASTSLLWHGDGYVEFTATETNRRRLAGLAIGDLPDLNPSETDISFGVVLEQGGQVVVYESGAKVFTYGGLYQENDRIRITAAGGVVQYFINGSLIYTSLGAVAYPLRVSASMWHQGATLTNVTATF